MALHRRHIEGIFLISYIIIIEIEIRERGIEFYLSSHNEAITHHPNFCVDDQLLLILLYCLSVSNEYGLQASNLISANFFIFDVVNFLSCWVQTGDDCLLVRLFSDSFVIEEQLISWCLQEVAVEELAIKEITVHFPVCVGPLKNTRNCLYLLTMTLPITR